MATAKLLRSDDEILVCSICLDTLKDPKILDCLHRFCKRCISEVIDQVPATDNVFPCPICRHEIDVPEDGAEGLKGDFLLASILENRAVERGLKDEQEEHPCSSCTTHSKIAAVCPDCRGFLCEVCLMSHRTMKVLQLHSHVTLADIQSGSITFNVDTLFSASRAPKCSVHKDMLLHINCKTCDKLICPVCAPIHHRSHELEEIETAAQRVRKKIKSTFLNKLHKVRESFTCGNEEVKGVSDGWNVEFDGIVNKITDHRDEKKGRINASLERVRKFERAAQEQLQNLEKGNDIMLSHVELMRGFYLHFMKKLFKLIDDKTSEVDNVESTARLLCEDTDNWRVLLASSDLFRKKVEPLSDEDFNEMDLPKLNKGIRWSFDSNRDSKFDGFEWEREASRNIGLHIDNGELLDVRCSSTKERFALIAVNRDENELISGFADTKRCDVSGKNTVRLGDTVGGAHIAAVRNNSIIFAVEICGINQIIDSTKGNIGQYNPEENESDDKSSLSCIRQGKNEKFIVGVRGSLTLYRCTLQGKSFASTNVTVDGMKPPVSLALPEDDGILLCDGVNHAVAVDSNGQLRSRYITRRSSDRPIRIAVDSDNLVYVLWKVTYDEDLSAILTGHPKSTANDLRNGMMVVMQYTLAGTFISHFKVDKGATMMTTVLKDNESDAILCATKDGRVEIYCMNELLKAFCKFVQEQDHTESGTGELCGN